MLNFQVLAQHAVEHVRHVSGGAPEIQRRWVGWLLPGECGPVPREPCGSA
jgi:hypothetical protein